MPLWDGISHSGDGFSGDRQKRKRAFKVTSDILSKRGQRAGVSRTLCTESMRRTWC